MANVTPEKVAEFSKLYSNERLLELAVGMLKVARDGATGYGKFSSEPVAWLQDNLTLTIMENRIKLVDFYSK